MRTRIAIGLAGVVLLLAAASVRAHHAFASEFDVNKPLTLRGTLTKLEWINPHSWFHVDVKDADGKVAEWMIEGGSPNAMLRLGFNLYVVPVGTEIVIEGYQAKDGTNKAVGKNLTLTDGRRMFLGSSAPGSQPDPKQR